MVKLTEENQSRANTKTGRRLQHGHSLPVPPLKESPVRHQAPPAADKQRAEPLLHHRYTPSGRARFHRGRSRAEKGEKEKREGETQTYHHGCERVETGSAMTSPTRT